jgi:hypothetical protein
LRQAPQLRRARFAAKKVCGHCRYAASLSSCSASPWSTRHKLPPFPSGSQGPVLG